MGNDLWRLRRRGMTTRRRRRVSPQSLMMILAPFAALMLQLFLSRTREYSADETGARMVGQPYGLISALQKLGAYNQRIPTTALCAVDRCAVHREAAVWRRDDCLPCSARILRSKIASPLCGEMTIVPER